MILTKMIEYSHKIKAEVKAIQSEIKKNIQGSNSRVDEAENQIKDLKHKEGKNNQSEQQEGKRNLKK